MKKLKILIAEDELMLQELYEMILESEYSCITTKVTNGLEAIAALESGSEFDLIISDFTMPVANGGKIYLHNKTHNNIPFFLLSGGDIRDYSDFADFKESNKLNRFFNKPFNDQEFIDAVEVISSHIIVPLEEKPASKYIKIKLDFYRQHTTTTAEVFIKLSEDKYTKIIQANTENVPDAELLAHYQRKGIEFIYVEEEYFKLFIKDIYESYNKKLLGEKKAEILLEMAGLKLNVSYEGLNSIGISEMQIDKVNSVVEESISTIFRDSSTKKQFQSLCENEGFVIGHSLLIMYIAGRICSEGDYQFQTVMKKICTAAFYHDYSLFEVDAKTAEMNPETIDDEKLSKLIFDHPNASTRFLPLGADVTDDVKKIILEHHEMPNGDGYPRKLSSSQISPLSSLFILSQQITYCIIRNDFSEERLRDFLIAQEKVFNQGNFATYYKSARKMFT